MLMPLPSPHLPSTLPSERSDYNARSTEAPSWDPPGAPWPAGSIPQSLGKQTSFILFCSFSLHAVLSSFILSKCLQLPLPLPPHSPPTSGFCYLFLPPGKPFPSHLCLTLITLDDSLGTSSRMCSGKPQLGRKTLPLVPQAPI